MSRGRLAALVLASTVLAAARGLPGDHVEWFLVPELALDAGFQNNRLLTASSITNSEDSAFLRSTPALALRMLAGDTWEFGLRLRHSQVSYARRDLETSAETSVALDAWRTRTRWDSGIAVDAGRLTDDAIPSDDRRWIGLAPVLEFRPDHAAWSVTGSARIDTTEYDHLSTVSGDALRETRTEVRPGLRWLPNDDTRLWIESYAENSDANSEGLDYGGAGLAAGAERWIGPRGRLAVWLQWGIRRFDDDGTAGETAGREDRPVDAGIRWSHRWRPWLELTASAGWRATGSNQDAQDLNAWSVQAGVILTDEIVLGRRSRRSATRTP